METFSRPPSRGTSDCADPEASWGHRSGGGPGQDSELFFGYYASAATMTREEHGPPVPELGRRPRLPRRTGRRRRCRGRRAGPPRSGRRRRPGRPAPPASERVSGVVMFLRTALVPPVTSPGPASSAEARQCTIGTHRFAPHPVCCSVRRQARRRFLRAADLVLGRNMLAGYQEQGPSLSGHPALVRSTGPSSLRSWTDRHHGGSVSMDAWRGCAPGGGSPTPSARCGEEEGTVPVSSNPMI